MSVTLMTPQQLYELWERQNWQSHTIDFSQDVRDWQRMDASLRSRLAWNLSSFFVGEHDREVLTHLPKELTVIS